MTTTTAPIFTRYLYEFNLVKYSLQQSIIEKKREEALFWAYELYHSGFREEVWEYVRQVYLQYWAIPERIMRVGIEGFSKRSGVETTEGSFLGEYSASNPLFYTRIVKMYDRWKETDDVCLLGTVVGTLAVWDREEDKNTGTTPSKQFIILYKDDRHQTIPVNFPPRHYLKQVSKYPIRGRLTAAERDAYLGTNWLYYCAKTPIWETRIREYRGTILERNHSLSFEDKSSLVTSPFGSPRTPTLILRSGVLANGEKEGEVAFNTDDDLESFYDKWGLEPDEQSLEMHTIHGCSN